MRPSNSTTPQKTKTYVHTKTCQQQMTTTALFRMAKNWKQSTGSVHQLVNANVIWYIHIMGYHVVTKRNDVLSDTCYNMDEHQKHYAE